MELQSRLTHVRNANRGKNIDAKRELGEGGHKGCMCVYYVRVIYFDHLEQNSSEILEFKVIYQTGEIFSYNHL